MESEKFKLNNIDIVLQLVLYYFKTLKRYNKYIGPTFCFIIMKIFPFFKRLSSFLAAGATVMLITSGTSSFNL